MEEAKVEKRRHMTASYVDGLAFVASMASGGSVPTLAPITSRKALLL